jgi:hypothetical protein
MAKTAQNQGRKPPVSAVENQVVVWFSRIKREVRAGQKKVGVCQSIRSSFFASRRLSFVANLQC